MKKAVIQQIRPEETWPIRHKVMWPDQPPEYVQLPEDALGQHYGLFIGQQLVSVVSLFVKGTSAQFRKFATLESEQGKGYGSQLLHRIFQEAKDQGMRQLWCNARIQKVGFYAKFGLKATEKTFTKGGINYVILVAPL
jgi:GNAT superfamily N-acetyltransferase